MKYEGNIGIIGHPIGHSKSPVFQQVALDHHNIVEKFRAWDVSPGDLPEILGHFRSDDFMAACVTLPHKINIIPYVDELTRTAKQVGAVNWVFKKNGNLIGHNTDCSGFIRSLKDQTGLDPQSKTVLVFGAGGACRAIIYGLKDSGAKKIIIANRTLDKAEQLVNDFSDSNTQISAIPLDKDNIKNIVRDCQLIVNTTSIGMSGGPLPKDSPLYSENIPPGIVGYDIVYAPVETPFLKEIQKAGGTFGNGISMLVYQGIEGFEMATGLDAPVEKMFAAFNKV